jgi:hypothetical protein
VPRRSTSLSNVAGSAITREIDSKYDVIKEVKENLAMLEELNSTDFDALIAELESAQDFSGITVVSGSPASWDAVTKTLTVPTLQGIAGNDGVDGAVGPQGPIGLTGPQGLQGIKGDTGSTGAAGVDGYNGLTPEIEMYVDANGDLHYGVVAYRRLDESDAGISVLDPLSPSVDEEW